MCWRQEHFGNGPRCIGVIEGLRAPTELSRGRDRLVAEVSERVEAALEQLAGDGQAGAIAT